MKDFEPITAVKDSIELQSNAALDIAKMAMVVVGTVVSVFYLTGKVNEFRINRKMRQIRKENKS